MKLPRSDCCIESVIEKLRQSRRPALLYGMAPEQSEGWLRELSEPLLRAMGLPYMDLHTARCCVRELGRHYRTRFGAPLAEHVEWSLAKYQDLGLGRDVLAQLLAVIDEAVGPRLEVGHALD